MPPQSPPSCSENQQRKRFAQQLEGHALVAPTLLPLELASVCVKKIRRHPSQRTVLLEALPLFERLPLTLHSVECAGRATSGGAVPADGLRRLLPPTGARIRRRTRDPRPGTSPGRHGALVSRTGSAHRQSHAHLRSVHPLSTAHPERRREAAPAGGIRRGGVNNRREG